MTPTQRNPGIALFAAKRLQAVLATVRSASLDLLYPAACASCGEAIPRSMPTSTAHLCNDCLEDLPLIIGPTCSRCGAPTPVGMTATSSECPRCRGRKVWFDAAFAAGEYTGRLRELVLAMKPVTGDRLSSTMGQLLWSRIGPKLQGKEIDVVAPIPIHWRRRLSHRTNSAAILAEVLANRLACPVAERLLRRRRHTPPQFNLTPSKRWENVRRAFFVRRAYHLSKAHVLLVDDVLTTGATCSEAARALKSAGANRVTVVVLARALSH